MCKKNFKPSQELYVLDYVYKDLGCWRDTIDRAIPPLEGEDVELYGDYQTRTDAVKKCGEAALRKGYTVFAVQHGGWCASSHDAEFTYSKYGSSGDCYGDGTGGPWANRVYKIGELQRLMPVLIVLNFESTSSFILSSFSFSKYFIFFLTHFHQSIQGKEGGTHIFCGKNYYIVYCMLKNKSRVAD